MKEPKYKVGDLVSFHTTGLNARQCFGKIVDIENHDLYNEPRYGLEVDGGSPYDLIPIPYLWEKELTLEEFP
jgi:hypothetical protein